jgi:hypothetical protein
MLGSFRMGVQPMHIIFGDETAYTTQYQVAFLKFVDNEYCARHRRVTVIKPKCVRNNHLFLVLAMVPVLDLAGIIGLRGNGLTPSKIDDFLSELSL